MGMERDELVGLLEGMVAGKRAAGFEVEGMTADEAADAAILQGITEIPTTVRLTGSDAFRAGLEVSRDDYRKTGDEL